MTAESGKYWGLIVDVMTSSAEVIRVNREEKPANVVKAQFAKLTKRACGFCVVQYGLQYYKSQKYPGGTSYGII